MYEQNGFGGFPVCIAKTHLSLSADPARKGAPTGWRLPVREARASAGAGFVYPICGDMRTMPGLTTHPAAEHIDIDAAGKVVGLSGPAPASHGRGRAADPVPASPQRPRRVSRTNPDRAGPGTWTCGSASSSTNSPPRGRPRGVARPRPSRLRSPLHCVR